MFTLCVNVWPNLVLLIVLITIQFFCASCGQSTSLPIKLTLKHACNDSAIFTYQPYPPLPHAYPNGNQHNSFSCQLAYWHHHAPRTSLSVLYDYPMSEREATISNLTQNVVYIAFISCGPKFRSNNVTFNVKACKDRSGSSSDTEVYSTPILLEESGLSQMSTIDVALGVIFGIFGAIILAAAGYYFWRHYQRRQRILRVFGQTHTDPFEALHNSTEESSIISL